MRFPYNFIVYVVAPLAITTSATTTTATLLKAHGSDTEMSTADRKVVARPRNGVAAMRFKAAKYRCLMSYFCCCHNAFVSIYVVSMLLEFVLLFAID